MKRYLPFSSVCSVAYLQWPASSSLKRHCQDTSDKALAAGDGVSLLKATDSSLVKIVFNDAAASEFQVCWQGLSIMAAFVGYGNQYLTFVSSAAVKNRQITPNRVKSLTGVTVQAKNNSLAGSKTDKMAVNVDASPPTAASNVTGSAGKTPVLQLDSWWEYQPQRECQGVMVYIDGKQTLSRVRRLINLLKSMPLDQLLTR